MLDSRSSPYGLDFDRWFMAVSWISVSMADEVPILLVPRQGPRCQVPPVLGKHYPAFAMRPVPAAWVEKLPRPTRIGAVPTTTAGSKDSIPADCHVRETRSNEERCAKREETTKRRGPHKGKVLTLTNPSRHDIIIERGWLHHGSSFWYASSEHVNSMYRYANYFTQVSERRRPSLSRNMVSRDSASVTSISKQ